MQVYNNDSMNKFEYPLDNLNYLFTTLSIIVYFLDIMLYQLMNYDMTWSVLSRRHAGFYEYEEGGATDNTDDVDS